MLAILMTMLTSLATVAYVLVKGVQYEVNATLLYQLGPELAPPPTMTRDPLMITRRAEDVNDEIEILTSPDLVHTVVEDLGEDFFLAPPPTSRWGKFKGRIKEVMQVVTGQIEEMMIQLGLRRRLGFLEKVEVVITQSLEVELVRESDVISVTLTSPDPEGGVAILEKLLEVYQERHLAIHQERAVKEFLGTQTSLLRSQLTASRDQLLVFQTSNDLWSSQDQQKLLLDNRKSIQMQVAVTSSQVANLNSLVKKLAAAVDELPEVVELSNSEQTNPARISLEDRLATLSMNSAVVAATYRSGSIERTAQDQQLRSLESVLGSEPPLIPHIRTAGLNQIRQDLLKEHALKSAELDGLRDQLTVEQTQLTEMNGALKKLGGAIAKYQHLDREHQMLEQKYALYVENFEKADIAAVMNLARISNVELISPPMSSKQPTTPKLKYVAAIGVLSGLVIAFAIGVVFDLRAAARLMTQPVTTV